MSYTVRSLASLAAAVALASPLALANHYGPNYYELATAPQQQQIVIAQADTKEQLIGQLGVTSEMEINELLAAEPTAAGGQSQIEKVTVVDHCYYSVQATACKTKEVYRLVE